MFTLIENIKEQNAKFYDTEAESYDRSRYSTRRGARVDRFQKRVLDSYLDTGELGGSSVLEVGCGTGRFLPFMANKGCSVTGIDISEEMLKVAMTRIAISESKDITLLLNDADSIPAEKNSFDIVYSILVINLLPNFEDVFKEINRVIKPNGSFIFSVPFLDSIYRPVGFYVNRRGKTVRSNPSGYRYSHWFGMKELKEALDKAGFKIKAVTGQPPHVQLFDDVKAFKTGIGLKFSKSIYVNAKVK